MKRADGHGQLHSGDEPIYRERARVVATVKSKVGELAMTSVALIFCFGGVSATASAEDVNKATSSQLDASHSLMLDCIALPTTKATLEN